MSGLELPALAAQAAPEFVDPEACKAWLDNVPLANVGAAQAQLLAELQEFNRFPTKAASRLAVMEALREAVNFVQIEQAKRFTSRALPMAQAEAAVFADTIELWEQMRLGYARCLEAALGGEPALRAQAALVCQRLLAYSGLKMFHHYRAYRQVSAREWRALHEAYANAEELEVAEEPVKDYLNRDVHDTSPRIAYARAVLMGMCNPNELGQRQLTFVAFLLERWAVKLEVLRLPPAQPEIAPLIADLAGDWCPERFDNPAAAKLVEPRTLDASKLAKSLRNRVGLLRKGESPARLALGEDCVQPSCEQLLVFLYRQWCQPKSPRAVERQRAAVAAQACGEMGAIHHYVTGSAFRQPGERRELTQRERQDLATFGRVRQEDDYSVARGYLLEEWQLEEESAQGLRMVRRAASRGKRYAHGQLIGVKAAGAKSFMLGQLRWLTQGDSGDLYAGVKLLPGLSAGVAVRPTGLNVQNEQYVPALSLTAAEALGSPPALVLPSGWYKPKRVIEVFVDSPVRARLTELRERGADFECVGYEIV